MMEVAGSFAGLFAGKVDGKPRRNSQCKSKKEIKYEMYRRFRRNSFDRSSFILLVHYTAMTCGVETGLGAAEPQI